ncbi:MAG: maspardin [Acidobacteriota bacterium]|jgi:pimeloyl-ACP methyl ester carboxylesterase|nr:maspardin [Acidobacteriota bacterium]MDT5261838.1 maspardin [Acidobacteriota bacterium]
MHEKRLVIKGVEWEYVTDGRGTQTLLLFHGAVGGAETMQWLASAFADEYRTITPTVAEVGTLEEVCDAVSAILDREHVGRAAVFGGSFGGLVAQAFFHRRRAQVEDLILLSTGVPNKKIGARTAWMTRVLRLLPFSLTRGLLKLEISKHLNTPVPPEHAARIHEFRQRLDEYFDHKLTKQTLLSRVALGVDFNRNESYAPAADHTDWPGRVLIVESNDDPMIPPEERRRLREAYPRALVCTFAGAGHMIPLLRLEELVSVVKAFLKEDYSSPSDIVEECAVTEGHMGGVMSDE